MASNREAALYLRSTKEDAHKALGAMLLLVQGGGNRKGERDLRELREKLSSLAEKLDASGPDLVGNLIAAIESASPDDLTLAVQGKGRRNVHGYWHVEINFGWAGQEVTSLLVEFFGHLLGDSGDARAYIESNDADWFCRFVDGEPVSEYYSEAFEDRSRDEEILANGVYAWWHDGLPDGIRQGQLNWPNAEEVYREIAELNAEE